MGKWTHPEHLEQRQAPRVGRANSGTDFSLPSGQDFGEDDTVNSTKKDGKMSSFMPRREASGGAKKNY
jgi:hypothetical protein